MAEPFPPVCPLQAPAAEKCLPIERSHGKIAVDFGGVPPDRAMCWFCSEKPNFHELIPMGNPSFDNRRAVVSMNKENTWPEQQSPQRKVADER